MLNHQSVRSTIQKVNSYYFVLGQQRFITTQNFQWRFSMYLKITKTFKFQSISITMPVKKNKTKKCGTNFDLKTKFVIENIRVFFHGIYSNLTPIFLLKNYESISMKFKIQVFYFYDKIKRSLWKRNKIRYSSMGHSQIWHHFFLVKIDQSILMIFKICITQFYHRTKCKQGTRAKSDNFPREILKLDIIFHWSQNNNQNLSIL